MQTARLIRFDWAIKRLLRNKADYTVLEGFLSVLLNDDIKIISVNESEGNQEHIKDKFNRVDMLVENSRKELLIIEIQNSEETDYHLRMLYGVSKAITEHMLKGNEYREVRKVYHINILYFRMGEGSDYVYHGTTEYRGIHNNTVLQLSQKEKRFFTKESVKDLYPEYYILCVDDFDNVAKNSLDEWIYYLKNTEIPENFTARGLKEAREKLRYDNLSKEEQNAYVHHLDRTNYERNALRTSYEKGEDKGREAGEAKGRAEEKIQTALNAINMGLNVDDIIKLTGLPKDQIERLIRENR